MESHIRAGHDKLPIVLPVVLYHGQVTGYPYALSIFDCFADKELAKQYAFNDFTLIDLTIKPDNEIGESGYFFFFELVLKYARDGQIIVKLIEFLKKYPEHKKYFTGKDCKTAFTSFLMSLDLNENTTPLEVIRELDNIAGVEIMTLRQQWEQRAKNEGVIAGIEQGMQQGRIEEKKATALNMLRKGLEASLVASCTGLSVNEIENLSKNGN